MKTKCKILLCCLFVLTSAMSIFAQPSANPASQNEDEAAIRKNVACMQEGWNTKSGALFAKPFAEDAEYVVINGLHFKSQKVIEQNHQHIFATIFQDSV